MKIRSIAFKNINSLKGEHEIDFTTDKFRHNPLFAITGATGSGKTTILDVISLALFCEVPRIGKISNSEVINKGAILTKNQEEAFAEVCYQCNAGVFKSVWSISTNRNGNLRDYEMEISKVRPPKSLDLNKSKVPKKNEELIGLTYSQFIKAVVLAQGEFAKFLKADKKERSQLLEQITGTGIYRRLGIKAYRKFKDQNDKIEQEEKILAAEKEELLSADYQKELNGELDQLREKIKTGEKEIEKLKDWLRQRIEIEGLTEKIEHKEKALEKVHARQESFVQNEGKALEAHEKVQPLSAELQEWKHKKEQLAQNEEAYRTLTKTREELDTERQKQLREINEFIGLNAGGENLEKELSDFYEKVSALQQQQSELKRDFETQERLFDREIKDLESGYTARDFAKNSTQWKDLVARAKTDYQQQKADFAEPPAELDSEIEAAEKKLKTIENARSDQRFIDKIAEDLTQTTTTCNELKEQLRALPEAIQTTKHHCELGREQLKRLNLEKEKSIIEADLETYRKKLQDGEVCPLCGSTEHPYSSHEPEGKSDLDNRLAAKEKEVTESQNRLSRLTAQKDERTEQLHRQATEQQAQSEKLKRQKEKFKEQYPDQFSVEDQDWPTLIADSEKHLEKLKRFQTLTERVQIIEEAAPIFETIEKILKKGKRVKETVEQYYQGKDLLGDVRHYESHWREVQKNIQFNRKQLTEAHEKLERDKKVFTEVADKLLPKLRAKGFDAISDAKNVLLSEDKYKALKEEASEIQDEINRLKTELTTIEQQKNALTETLKTAKDQRELQNEKTDTEAALNNWKKAKEECLRLLKNNNERLEKTGKRAKAIEEERAKNHRWIMLNKLIGDAKGDRFTQFAQDLTLRHLLKLANKRLKDLSKRYRLREASTKDGSLEVADLDMGNQRRSVKTLSGGETFLLSLSLALALSDLASKNVSINSLFIDEGFGTLDPETLDQTLDTLERLQMSSSKMIGIISHVESLKERIGTQIQLSKNGQGYSDLKVI